MLHLELVEFNKSQLNEIDKHKWIESEKAGEDLGDVAILDWIEKFSQAFRREWEGEK